jgi:hypothetical protein
MTKEDIKKKKEWIFDKNFEDDIYYGFLLLQKRHPPPLS